MNNSVRNEANLLQEWVLLKWPSWMTISWIILTLDEFSQLLWKRNKQKKKPEFLREHITRQCLNSYAEADREKKNRKKNRTKLIPKHHSRLNRCFHPPPPLAIGLSSLLFQNRPYCEWNTLWYWVSLVSIISRNGKFQMEPNGPQSADPLRKRRF